MIVVVDFNNIVYSAFHKSLRQNGIKDMTQLNWFYAGHVDTFRIMLLKLLNGITYNRIVFALDSKPKHRQALYADYKAQREPLPINPKLAIAKEMETWNGETLYSNGYEADDAMAAFVARHEEEPITVLTSDKDMWQILDHDNVTIMNPVKVKCVDKADLKDAFDVEEYSHIKLVKALWGDSSDNIKNAVPRMQRYLLPIIRESDGTLDDFFDRVFQPGVKLSGKCLEYLKNNQKLIETNYQLASLVYTCPYLLEPLADIGKYMSSGRDQPAPEGVVPLQMVPGASIGGYTI